MRLQYPDVDVRKQTREAVQILSNTVPLSVCAWFKLIKQAGEKKCVSVRYCSYQLLAAPCIWFQWTAVIWKPLKSTPCLSPERPLCLPPKFWGQPNQGGKILPYPTAVFIASAGFSAMAQEPMAITRARSSSPSNATADDKARLPAGLSTTLMGAQKEPEAGTEVWPSSSKHSKESCSCKRCWLGLGKIQP